MVNWKKKELIPKCISKILLIDTGKLSKVLIFPEIFLKDFVDRFEIS